MNSSTVYSTSLGRGVGQNAGTSAIGVHTETGGIDWLHYVIYFLAAVLVIWIALYVVIRTGVVGPNDWLYENTKRIPWIHEGFWARNDATTVANPSANATTSSTN